MKKNYKQPALEFVRMISRDIITTSPNGVNNEYIEGKPTLAPDRSIFDPYDPYNEGY